MRGSAAPGTVGFPLPGVEVQLGAERRDPGPGPQRLRRLLGAAGGHADAFAPSADGGPAWFRTGDLGVDDDGYLAIRGRSKELIISGGITSTRREVEDVLAAHPRVAEVAVTGTPSDEWGEVVTAWVVADGRPPTLDDLAGVLRHHPGPLQAAPADPRGGRPAPQRAREGAQEPARRCDQALGSGGWDGMLD